MKIVYTFSGGAAYGYAHIGVLKFLEESGLEPGAIVGTSMGAIVGGLYACGYDADRIEEIAEETRGVDLMRLFFPSFPRGGIIDTDGIRDFFREYVGDRRIEDLPVTFRSVAVDIDTGDEIIFDRGRLIDAMIASMSIPAVFKPYYYGGRFLVDGGVVNNLPWDVARQFGRHHIIVNAAPERAEGRRRIYTSQFPSGEEAADSEDGRPALLRRRAEGGLFQRGNETAKKTGEKRAETPATEAADGSREDEGNGEEGIMPFRRIRERFGGFDGVSFQHLMKSFARPAEEQGKSIGLPEIITNVMAIVNERIELPRSVRGWKYVYLHPDLTGYSLNDFQKAGDIISVGYRTAQETPSFVKGVGTIAAGKRRG
jgi:NTE family protein